MAAWHCLRLRRKKEGHARRGRKAPRARRKRSLRYAKGGIACEGLPAAQKALPASAARNAFREEPTGVQEMRSQCGQ